MLSAFFEVREPKSTAASFAVSSKGRKLKTTTQSSTKQTKKNTKKAEPKPRDPDASSYASFEKPEDEPEGPKPYRETFGENSERICTPDVDDTAADCWDYLLEEADHPDETEDSESRDFEFEETDRMEEFSSTSPLTTEDVDDLFFLRRKQRKIVVYNGPMLSLEDEDDIE